MGRKVGRIECINIEDIWSAERRFTPSVCLLLLICEGYGTETNKIKLNTPELVKERKSSIRNTLIPLAAVQIQRSQLFKHTFITQMNEWTWLATVACCRLLQTAACVGCLLLFHERAVTVFALLVTPSLISARWLKPTHDTTPLHRFECFLKYCLLGFFFTKLLPHHYRVKPKY